VTDQQLLEQALKRLRTTGEIEYTGEFGAEIATFVPFVFWLKAQGLLADRRVVTYAGMQPYYYFLEDDEYAEKTVKRSWLPPDGRDWPSNSTYTATRQDWHCIPDYRQRYRTEGKTFERPVLFIQNKFCVEWHIGPINYIPLYVLQQLFALAGDRFDIVYSRPRRMQERSEYSTDDNADCEYPDLVTAKLFPNVTVLEDFCVETGLSYNLAKLQILAKSHLFIAVQGGGAHLMASFSDALMLLLHREGQEFPHAYATGVYKYLATPPPILMVAHNSVQFARGASLIANVGHVGGRFEIGEKWLPVLEELRV
jgi:hypothetical protein